MTRLAPAQRAVTSLRDFRDSHCAALVLAAARHLDDALRFSFCVTVRCHLRPLRAVQYRHCAAPIRALFGQSACRDQRRLNRVHYIEGGWQCCLADFVECMP